LLFLFFYPQDHENQGGNQIKSAIPRLVFSGQKRLEPNRPASAPGLVSSHHIKSAVKAGSGSAQLGELLASAKPGRRVEPASTDCRLSAGSIQRMKQSKSESDARGSGWWLRLSKDRLLRLMANAEVVIRDPRQRWWNCCCIANICWWNQ